MPTAVTSTLCECDVTCTIDLCDGLSRHQQVLRGVMSAEHVSQANAAVEAWEAQGVVSSSDGRRFTMPYGVYTTGPLHLLAADSGTHYLPLCTQNVLCRPRGCHHDIIICLSVCARRQHDDT